MSDPSDIKNLIHLLSAESEKVRESVLAELQSRAHQLEPFLTHYGSGLEPDVLYQLHKLITDYKSSKLRTNWLRWTNLKSEALQLEAGLSFLAQTHRGDNNFRPLPQLLDEQVREFLMKMGETSVTALNAYLFESGRLQGSEEDYYHPLNSNLAYVLSSGKGLPISLACIMILMGYRLGLDVRGFNLPGRFLVRARECGQYVLIDCFGGGKRLGEGEMAALSLSPRVDYTHLLNNPPSAVEIITRVLNNLLHAYHRTGDLEMQILTQDLLTDLNNHSSGKTGLVRSSVPTIFSPGQIVRHNTYRYRGVVVALDLTCQADDDWYRSNRMQPDKNQPWYHVLVDGSAITTYAAQSNLEADNSGGEVRHPLIGMYFQGFSNGSYERNDVPWSM